MITTSYISRARAPIRHRGFESYSKTGRYKVEYQRINQSEKIIGDIWMPSLKKASVRTISKLHKRMGHQQRCGKVTHVRFLGVCRLGGSVILCRWNIPLDKLYRQLIPWRTSLKCKSAWANFNGRKNLSRSSTSSHVSFERLDHPRMYAAMSLKSVIVELHHKCLSCCALMACSGWSTLCCGDYIILVSYNNLFLLFRFCYW